MEPRWLTDDELTAWLRLIALAELLPSRLDTQLRRDWALTHFEYQVLAMLSEAPERTLRMSWLAQRTQATLPRLSHVARRLEGRGLLVRRPSQTDARATDATLTDAGMEVIVAAAPGHVTLVREEVFDALTPEQVGQLSEICTAILDRLDPEGHLTMKAAEAPR